MFNISRVFLFVIISFSINTDALAQASFDEIISYTEKQQLNYLKKASQEVMISAKKDPESFVKMLVDISGAQNSASGIALYYLQTFLLQISDNSRGYRQPGYTQIRDSSYINNKLSEIILLPDVNKKLLKGAVMAHSLIYPPNKKLLEKYKEIIIEANPRKGGVIKNILASYDNYQRHDNYQIPSYVYEKLPELINHHSDGVQTQSIKMLADKNGIDYLPTLFTLLESNNHGSSVSQSIVYKILSLDASNKTILALEKSREKVNNTRIKKMISTSLLPENLARQRKRNEQWC